MSTAALLAIGSAIARIVIRLTSSTPDFAGVLEDAGAAGTAARELRPRRTDEDRLAKEIADALAREVHFDVDQQADLTSAAMDVENLIRTMFKDDHALIAAAMDPEGIYEYIRDHGGSELLRLAPQRSERFMDGLLRTSSEQFARYAPQSPHFSPAALKRLLRLAEAQDASHDETRRALATISDHLVPAHSRLAPSTLARCARIRRPLVRAAVHGSDTPVVGRPDLVSLALEASDYPVAFIGDGGLGKSILIGEIADQSTERELVIVACSAIDGTEDLVSATQIDDRLGQQVSGEHAPLSAVLAAFTDRPLLVIDTLDILLREQTAAALSTLLSAWTEQADVVLTCRGREWRDLLSPRQHTFVVHDMPTLTREQALSWSDTFVAHEVVPHAAAASFRRDLEEALSSPRSLRVLGVPLRLAMATRLYAPTGALPSDLTATKLYKAYWADRVSTGRDGRRKTRASRAVEEAALEVAAGIWRQSTDRFVEDLRHTGDLDAQNALISEGVLELTGLRVHFFHQTFAEFAVARHLGAEGSGNDFARLRDGLRIYRSGYWGIAGHLVREELTTQRFTDIVEHIPYDSVEGVRVVTEGVLERNEVDVVEAQLARLLGVSPNYLAAASDILAAAPAPHMYAAASALCVLVESSSEGLTAVVRAVAGLIRHLPDEQSCALLDRVLTALASRARQRDELIASESRRLIDAVFPPTAPVNGALLKIAIAHYAQQPSPGQRAMISAALRCNDAALESDLISEAMQRAVPSAAVDDLSTLVSREAIEPGRLRRQGWRSWSDVLSLALPKRWDTIQVRVIARVAAADARARAELITESLEPRFRARRDIVVNALRFVADAEPEDFAQALLQWNGAPNRPRARAYAKLVLQVERRLHPQEREQIVRRLRTMVQHEPRFVWATIMRLVSQDGRQLPDILDELFQFVENHPDSARTVVADATDGLLRTVSPEDLAVVFPSVKALWALVDGRGGTYTETALGLMAAVSVSAREDIDALVDSQKKNAQVAALRSLVQNRERWPVGAWYDTLPWLVGLLRSRNHGAVIAICTAIVKDVTHERWSAAETTVVLERLVVALERSDDPQVSGQLIAVLAAAAHGHAAAAPTPGQVEKLLALLKTRLMAVTDDSHPQYEMALYPQYTHVVTRIALRVLGMSRTTGLVEAFLRDVDIARFGGRARKDLSVALAAVYHGSPSWWSALERMWPEIPRQNRGAIAELAMSGLIPERDAVCERLARRPDCPPDIAADLLRRK